MKGSKSIVVTGGAGFIGKHLIKRIIRTNKLHRVIVIDNLCNSNWDDFIQFIVRHKLSSRSRFPSATTDTKGLRVSEMITLYKIDIRNFDDIKRVLEQEIQKDTRISACVHLAANISVAESMLKPRETREINVTGTDNVVKCARKIGIKQFVFASSAAVYGIPTKLPISESETPNPTSEYGKSKLNAEMIVAGYSGKNRRGTSLRMFNVYGTGQTKEYAGVITKFVDRIWRNLPPEIYGNGLQTRDFVHINDVVDALMRAAGFTKKKILTRAQATTNNNDLQMSLPNDPSQMTDLNSSVYNIGTGKATRINDLACLITDIMVPSYDFNRRAALRPVYLDPIAGDIDKSCADIRRARYGLGFVPTVNLRDGLKNTVEKNLSY